MSIPTFARTVIVGGGVIGSSLAYHLSKYHKAAGSIVLLEAQKVTSGTTWHAAGLVGSTRNTSAETRLSVVGTEMYQTLKDETGLDPGFKRSGSVNVARTKDRMHNFHRTTNKINSFGLEAKILTPEEVHEAYTSPIDGICAMKTDDIVGGIHIPGDGAGSPTDLTQALLRGAKNRNVEVFEDKRVRSFGKSEDESTVTSVTLDSGETIEAENVVLCAGQWSRQVGALAGVNVPLHSAEHFYATTQNEIEGIWNMMPVCRDPDALIYMREWGNTLLFGGFEEQSKPWGSKAEGNVPEDFEFSLLEDDWDHFYSLFEGAMERVPALETAELKLLNGPESFTPDGNYILGEAPELKNFYVCAGMNSSGIASAGGAGKALADWIVNKSPQMELAPVDIRRFHNHSINPTFLKERVIETLGLHYTMPYPRKELKSVRNIRQSALFEKLKGKGAIMGQRFGWERPNYFAPTPIDSPLTYGRPGWLLNVTSEVQACREKCAVFDISSFSKLTVEGSGVTEFMNELCAGEMNVEVGKLVYTGMLNERGGYEADVTVTRVTRDKYFIVTATAQANKDMQRIKRRMPKTCFCSDVTGQYSVLSVMGPNSRELLQGLSTESFENEDFEFGTSKEVDIGLFNLTAKRVTYVGELGWELYVPVESARGVYDALFEASSEKGLGLKDAGYYAIEAMRIEKGYRAVLHEIDTEVTPKMAGLSFVVAKGKKSFEGKDRWNEGRGERLFNFKVNDEDNDDLMLWGGEIVTLDGDVIGELTSGTFSPTMNANIGMGLLKHDEVYSKGWIKAMSDAGRLRLLVGERDVGVEAKLGCWYDPKGEKIKGL
ncbi:hypothetical protein TrLO_g10015 [Triparma laevis f. longispina]|uniref:FAD-dependent oxidoreductase n=1 Tax=Triparma laevis f. longispina TaxID=1714387 RepID=A0A9W6ZR10_9STRA|nr:hypothetical protein TrLO_g10015 [Triparma laevis f. longispina]